MHTASPTCGNAEVRPAAEPVTSRREFLTTAVQAAGGRSGVHGLAPSKGVATDVANGFGGRWL